ncbi:MAG: heavy metal translocating P-type ATPase [Actinomycetota bacterium]
MAETGTMAFLADRALRPVDVADVERRARLLPGVLSVHPGRAADQVEVEYDPALLRPELLRLQLESPYLRLAGRDPLGTRLPRALAPRRIAHTASLLAHAPNRVAIGFVAMTLLLLVVGLVVQQASSAAALPVWLAAFVFGGWFSLRTTLASLRARRLGVDLLMLIAAAGAYTVGAFWEGTVLLFLFSLGNVLEEFALGRTEASIRALMDLRPEVVQVKGADGTEREVPAAEVEPGMIAVVRPGDRIPVDGVVHAGHSAVDQSAITGESLPVPRDQGQEVLAGSVNLDGYLEVRVVKRADETVLAKVIELVRDAREQRAPAQRMLDRYQPIYVVGVLGLSGGALAVLLLLGHSFSEAFLQAMTLLVVASPCALVISVPATMLSAIAAGARHGILVKGSGPMEGIAELTAIAFDKTGTLTKGSPSVVGVGSADGTAEAEVLALAASAESRSEHHLAVAIVAEAEERGIAVVEPEAFQARVGRGVEATVAGRAVLVGNLDFLVERGVRPDGALAGFRDLHPTDTIVGVARDGALVGMVAVADELRPEAAEAIRRLKGLGIRTAMLSGDRQAVADKVAEEIGIDDPLGELLPDQKVERLGVLAGGRRIGMVGDGVNDAPALAIADVGIAMGGRGTDQALETADVVLMADRLLDVPYAVELARRMRRVVRQNLVFAGSVIIVLAVLTLFDKVPLPLGVFGHEGSTIIVTMNGLRLLRR